MSKGILFNSNSSFPKESVVIKDNVVIDNVDVEVISIPAKLNIEPILQQIVDKNWKTSMLFSPELSYCFVFSASDKQLGFSQSEKLDTDVVLKSFNQAVKTSEKSVKQKEKLVEQEPLLFDDDLMELAKISSVPLDNLD